MREEQVIVGSDNVFADIGFPDAETHQLKAFIVMEVYRQIDRRKLTQTAAGKILGIAQPEVSKMLNGHFRDYSVKRLLDFLTLFDGDVEIRVKYREAGSGSGQITFNPNEATA